ncbi:GNAT family N-acetyltransferase [Streptomyces bambusae]|uniref:GNAT family N-acetyltransferase n=1 Tax=Streptomyces bambusae TaxID=1550616 RepID=UPI001CFEA7A2|nr:GNAT family N-acetyltransferase [Streptomyces bambusae]MCB5168975.1 GNAT family N-acetyltransferase [Streptomyces bambusae]
MTTTLRPTGPLQQSSSGARVRAYEVCVNSRHVGALELGTDTPFGPVLGEIRGLYIDEPDRGRGRGAVAALAAEEVLRSWGCRRVRTAVPADSAAGRRLAAALGYREVSRNMVKDLDGAPCPLPDGITGRPMTAAEYGPWLVRAIENYAKEWTDRGLPAEAAQAKSRADHDSLLPDGLDTPGVWFRVLEQADGATLGTLWVSRHDRVLPDRAGAYVFDVEVAEEHRGRGHGRSLMLLAEEVALADGAPLIGLNVFAGNTPALRLYESLGYRPSSYNYGKDLV